MRGFWGDIRMEGGTCYCLGLMTFIVQSSLLDLRVTGGWTVLVNILFANTMPVGCRRDPWPGSLPGQLLLRAAQLCASLGPHAAGTCISLLGLP